MATITDADFEGTYPPTGYSEFGTAVANIGTSTVQQNSGATSVRVNNTGGAATAYIEDTVSNNVLITRFYLRIAQAVSALSNIFSFTNANGSVFLRLTTASVIRVVLNTTSFDGPTLSTGVWYRIDIRADSSGSSIVVDWQVDGSAQTQRTRVQTAANCTAVALGMATSVTCDLYYDDLKVTDTSGDYPLGPIQVQVPFTSSMPALIAQ